MYSELTLSLVCLANQADAVAGNGSDGHSFFYREAGATPGAAAAAATEVHPRTARGEPMPFPPCASQLSCCGGMCRWKAGTMDNVSETQAWTWM
jgi:hypothetical protein